MTTPFTVARRSDNPVPPVFPLAFGPYAGVPFNELPDHYVLFMLRYQPHQLRVEQYRAMQAMVCNWIGVELTVTTQDDEI